MTVHCLFEQSGTFKNEFKKLGYNALDYDILNDYGETDVIIDLFSEIRGGYEGKNSIFDSFTKDDLILAFFPCIRFENQIMLSFRGQNYGVHNWPDRDKILFDMRLIAELKEYYDIVCMLFILCIDRGLRLVMENPYSEEHFLRRYWCIKPAIIDRDRRENGDYFKKPTQYWFYNVKPKDNLIFEPVSYNQIGILDANNKILKKHYSKIVAKTKTQAKSMMHPEYANRFIRRYLIDEVGK